MSDAIAALANRFWRVHRVHPEEIRDLGITREQFYEREMRTLFATQADRIAVLEAALRSIANKCPATCDMTLAHEMAEEAEAALAPEQDK